MEGGVPQKPQKQPTAKSVIIFCEHSRQRYFCKECGGNAICKHGKKKKLLQRMFVSMAKTNFIAKNATDLRSVNTKNQSTFAKSVVEKESASTVKTNFTAKSVFNRGFNRGFIT